MLNVLIPMNQNTKPVNTLLDTCGECNLITYDYARSQGLIIRTFNGKVLPMKEEKNSTNKPIRPMASPLVPLSLMEFLLN